MEAEEGQKTAKAWEHLSCYASDGHEVDEGGRGPHSSDILDFIIEFSVARQDPRHSYKIVSTSLDR